MRRIHLTSPASDNAGRFHDAGSEMEVGTLPDRIHPDRAEALLEQGRAELVSREDEVLDLAADEHAYAVAVER